MQYLAHRFLGFLLLIATVFAAPLSASATRVACVKDGDPYCVDAAGGCFIRGSDVVLIRCDSAEMRKAFDGITCNQVPKPRADGEVLNGRCVMMHECDHAEVYKQDLNLNLCAAEFSAYLKSAKCLRESQKSFCPDGIPANECEDLSDEEKGDRLVMEFLRCKQRGGSKSICETQCLSSGAKLLGKATSRAFCANVFEVLGNCDKKKF